MAIKASPEKNRTLAGLVVVAVGHQQPGIVSPQQKADVIDRGQFRRGNHGQDCAGIVLTYAPVVDSPLIDSSSTLRFAVATFDSGNDLRDALRGLRQDGLREDAFCCLGLEEILADAALLAVSPATARLTLRFPKPDSADRLYNRPAGRSPGGAAACRGGQR